MVGNSSASAMKERTYLEHVYLKLRNASQLRDLHAQSYHTFHAQFGHRTSSSRLQWDIHGWSKRVVQSIAHIVLYAAHAMYQTVPNCSQPRWCRWPRIIPEFRAISSFSWNVYLLSITSSHLRRHGQAMGVQDIMFKIPEHSVQA